jgi:soluble lytic murein transglycosylase
MAQEPSSRDLLEAVKQQESGGRRYDKSGKLLEGPPTKYGTAKGEMQVLDMTNKDPGFGVRPAKDDSPDERARVGRDYLAAMKKRYGNTETALIAYNWGPGNTDKWLKAGANPAKLPKETQKYVANITASLGGTKVAPLLRLSLRL